MITWIQTVLQKHHKSVFGVLLVAIIIAFVFTIGSVPFFGDSHRTESRKGKLFYGFDLSNDSCKIAYTSNLFSRDNSRSRRRSSRSWFSDRRTCAASQANSV